MSGDQYRSAVSRRSALRLGALAILAPPLLAACGPKDDTAPNGVDQLTPFYTSALADVATANAAAKAFPSDAPTFQVAAQVRQAHASALAKEISRAAASSTTPKPSAGAPASAGASESDAVNALVAALNKTAASTLVQQVPRYRAGLVASVCGGCASLAQALTGSPVPTARAERRSCWPPVRRSGALDSGHRSPRYRRRWPPNTPRSGCAAPPTRS